ncbi:hypothetical protein CQA49_08160 [Helicobacter sp. MIT 00-7814]|uniref:site-specific integrase n=1 Tax=unclassified Helicobacter TaxID=2593540 RepID=UPI000E1EC608|nr:MULTISPECIES: site-specific integrase [unclassified Helicobacter]RDU51727.1 hypothetical protein CQA37_09435 [Helicobacter sp. MIT 99-10781]RDU52579.1 hypothetical protein CQA49_08160 [Helicobacter sp. MIT 00-7814]
MTIKTINTYVRGGKLYIDSYTEYGRARFSSGLSVEQGRKLSKEALQNLVYAYFRGDTQEKVTHFSFKALCEKYIQAKSLKDQTIRDYKSMVNCLSKVFGSKDIRVISTESLKAFVSQPKGARFKNYINRLINFANDNYNLGVKKVISTNITQTESKRKMMPFSLDEIKILLDSSSGDLYLYLAIGFFTGARSGEILALEWSDIDFEFDKIQITKSRQQNGKITTPKTSNSKRSIDLLPPLKEILQKRAQTSGYIIKSKKDNIISEYKKLLELKGLEYRNTYNTRHSFATLMLTRGEEPLWVCAMMGHASLQVTYTHYTKYIPQKQARAQFLNDFLK